MSIDRRQCVAGGLALALMPRGAHAQPRTVEADIVVSDSRVTIGALINGKGPFSLIVDTGAQISGLRQGAVDALALKPRRDIRLGGRPFPLFAVDDLLLGGAVRQQGALFFGLGESTQLSGDGLVDAGIITSVDSELLFEAQRWRVHLAGFGDTSRYGMAEARLEPAKVAGLSARLFGRVAVGESTLDMVWDTGAHHALSIPASQARRLGLLDPAQVYAPVPSAGIHGLARQPARLFAAPTIRVGEHVFEGLHGVIRMDDDTEGALILGYPVLRCLDLAIARGGAFIGIRRNNLKPINPAYLLAGIWIDPAPNGVRVTEVGVGSPAAEAGLRPGDLITNLGDLPAALANLRGDGAAELALIVRRQNQSEAVTLKLRDYLR